MRLCSHIGVPFHHGMLDPYANESAIRSFYPVRDVASTDPKLLRHTSRQTHKADDWKRAARALMPETLQVTAALGYNTGVLLGAGHASLTLLRAGSIDRRVYVVHDFTGAVPADFAKHFHAADCCCFGIELTAEAVQGCKYITDLAVRYVRALEPVARDCAVLLVGISFGCRIAYRMAQILATTSRDVRLGLLDGPIGPHGPARMGGMVNAVHDALLDHQPVAALLDHEHAKDRRDVARAVAAVKAQRDARASAALIVLADDEPAVTAPLDVRARYYSATHSFNHSNGSVDTARQCVRDLEVVEVDSTHFAIHTMDALSSLCELLV